MAAETVRILDAGFYTQAQGQVDLSDTLARAKNATLLYLPEDAGILRKNYSSGRTLQTSIVNQTSLKAAKKMLDSGIDDCVVLNFASATSPGGGFLRGAEAQEEFLARSSGLYSCLLTQPTYYTANKNLQSALYTDHIIYSPGVPVIRDDYGILLNQPYTVAMITAPAPNAGVISRREERDAIVPTLMNRMEMVLSIAATHGHKNLVLGAWGCGAFKNDSRVVAQMFKEFLFKAPAFNGAFDKVVFAVLDYSQDSRYIGPFEKVFA